MPLAALPPARGAFLIPDILVGPTGIVAMVVAWGMAAVVYFAGPANPQSRLLAPLLLLEGVAMGTLFGFGVWAPTPGTALGLHALNIITALAVAPLYLLFLGTLGTPIAGMFAWRPVRWVLLGYTAAILPIWFVAHDLFIAGATTGSLSRYGAIEGPGAVFAILALGLVFYYGLVVAFVKWRQAPPGSQERYQARLFVIAFGTRDLITGTLLVGQSFVQHNRTTAEVMAFGFPVATLLFVTFMGYAILKARLFDIDLKIKWGIARGALIGIFLAVFFVVSVSAENFLTERYGWAVGGTAAGLLLFALTPLQRLAARVSDAAMPGVQDTSEYRTVRKREVYQAALESALVHGGISDRERGMLATLASQLALDPKDAYDLERAAKAAGRDGPVGVTAGGGGA